MGVAGRRPPRHPVPEGTSTMFRDVIAVEWGLVGQAYRFLRGAREGHAGDPKSTIQRINVHFDERFIEVWLVREGVTAECYVISYSTPLWIKYEAP